MNERAAKVCSNRLIRSCFWTTMLQSIGVYAHVHTAYAFSHIFGYTRLQYQRSNNTCYFRVRYSVRRRCLDPTVDVHEFTISKRLISYDFDYNVWQDAAQRLAYIFIFGCRSTRITALLGIIIMFCLLNENIEQCVIRHFDAICCASKSILCSGRVYGGVCVTWRNLMRRAQMFDGRALAKRHVIWKFVVKKKMKRNLSHA